MAYPAPFGSLPITPGTIYKFTFFLNGPNCGTTETFYIQSGKSPLTTTLSEYIGAGYANMRAPFLTSVWSIQAYRFIDVTQPRGGALHKLASWPRTGEYPLSASNQGFWPTSVNTGVQILLTDGSGTIRRNQIFHGIPQTIIGANNTNPNVIGPSGVFQTFKTNLVAWLAQASSQPNALTGVVGAKFFVKDPSVNKPAMIQTITTGVNNWLQFTTLGINNGTAIAPDYVAPPWVAGTKILIGGLRQKCSRKLNGLARVVSVTTLATTPVTYQVLVCKPNCCLGTPIFCPQAGTMQLALYNYSPLTAIDAQLIASRKVGRPFRLRPGRRPDCCS